jgi:hypothetical protein
MNTLRVKRLQALIKDEKSLFVKRNKKANRSWSLIEAAAGRQEAAKVSFSFWRPGTGFILGARFANPCA